MCFFFAFMCINVVCGANKICLIGICIEFRFDFVLFVNRKSMNQRNIFNVCMKKKKKKKYRTKIIWQLKNKISHQTDHA